MLGLPAQLAADLLGRSHQPRRIARAARRLDYRDQAPGHAVRRLDHLAHRIARPVAEVVDQLMEHLHPDDALDQLQNIFTALTSAGVYLCITPNRLNGPHDISMYFDEVATGFHLHEYTITELSDLFKKVGFSKVRVYIWKRGLFLDFGHF